MKKLIVISALLFSFNGMASNLWIPIIFDSEGNLNPNSDYNANPKFLRHYQTNEKYKIALECKGSKEDIVDGKTINTDSFINLVYIETIKDQEDLDDIPIRIEAGGSTYIENVCKANEIEFSCIYSVASRNDDGGYTYDLLNSIRINRSSGRYSSQALAKSGDRIFVNFYEGYCSLLSDQKF
jgi:hypothetical protein